MVEGRTVINPPDRVLATARSQPAHRTLGTVAVPRCQVVPTARAARPGVYVADGEWWVKGGDLHASRREDVLRLGTITELGCVLNDFERRGIGTAVLQQHVPGREIRFYAVGGDFFYWLNQTIQRFMALAARHFRRARWNRELPCHSTSSAVIS